MRVCNLSSGSDGNVTYIENASTKILVDIGLSCKETEKRLAILKVSPSDIDAILISHEHFDHIKGLDVFANKYGTKVYVHEKGYIPLLNKLKKHLNIITFDDFDFFINDLQISTIALPHDVERCSGYIIREKEKKISIITDLGYTTNEILQNLYNSSLVFLEANHDIEKLLHNEAYPVALKRRILGNNGHLSNEACAKAIINLAQNGCKQIVLAHLSSKNNSPKFAYNYINKTLAQYGIIEGKNIKITVATTSIKTIFNLNDHNSQNNS